MANANAVFDYPNPALADDSELKRHCLYRLSRDKWLRGQSYLDATSGIGPFLVADRGHFATQVGRLKMDIRNLEASLCGGGESIADPIKLGLAGAI